jgi:tetratricopeptide (TPR) repeat protein/TolB-like protein
MKYFLYILGCFFLLAAVQCGTENNRRIKLAVRTDNALMKEKVATIQIAAARKKSLAVLPFTNRTGRASQDWLEQGIVEMLVTDLSQSRQLNVLPSDKVAEAFRVLGIDRQSVSDSLMAWQVANFMHAEAFISGRYFMHNDSLFIELNLHDGKTGALMNKEIVGGGGLENVFTMMDQIAHNLRGNLQITLREPREVDHSIADFMTKSVEAYKWYVQGVEAINKFYPREALGCFEKAVQADSTFASAYLRLALAYHQLGNLDKMRSLASKAVAYADQATPKERLNILAINALMQGDLMQAIELYKQMTDMFPEDDEAHYNLGTYYCGSGFYPKGIEQLEAAVALNPQNKLAYNQLGYAYAKNGKLDYAIHALQRYAELAEDEPNPYDSMGEILHIEGRIEAAIQYYEKALKKNTKFRPSLTKLAAAYLDLGRSDKARKIADKLIKTAESDDEKVQALLLLSQVEIVNNNPDVAKETIEKAYQIKPGEFGILYALCAVDQDSVANCRRLADWINHLQSKSSASALSFEQIFNLAAASLSLECDLENTEIRLDQFLKNTSNEVVRLIAYSFKGIVEDYRGNPVSSSTEGLIFQPDPKAMLSLPPVSWERFWRFYFTSLERSNRSNASLIDEQRIRRDFARENGSLQFDIGFTSGIALLYSLHGDLQGNVRELQKIGVPDEDAWRVCGPFKMTQGFQQRFWPEKIKAEALLGTSGETINWIKNPDNLKDGYLDFKSIHNVGLNDAAYAYLEIGSPTARNIQLRFGSNKPIKVWLNDDLVLTKNIFSEARIDEYITYVHLNSGTNRLVVKLSGRNGVMGFYFRATDKQGYGIPDITFKPTPIV